MSLPGKHRAAAVLVLAMALAPSALRAQPVALYGSAHRVIRAAIISIPPGSASPHVFNILGNSQVAEGISFTFYAPKPPGWEFANPIAPPGLSKWDPQYWTLNLSVAPEADRPLLGNFDVILVCVRPGFALLPLQQRVLAEWVEQGGLLWIDNQSDAGTSVGLEHFFGLVFAPRGGPAVKVALDSTHPLLRGLFWLSDADIEMLGVQNAAGASLLSGITAGVSAADLVAGFPQFLLQEILRETDGITTLPSIAAARLGKGAIVVTACGVAQGISGWYESLSGATPTLTELPEWAIPDAKFAYNMIEWAQTWASGQAEPGRRGRSGGDLTAPLAQRWRIDRDMLGTVLTELGGSAVIDGGMLFFGDSQSLVHAFDLRPERDLDGDGRADDGPDVDLSLGTAYDEVWTANLAAPPPLGLGPGPWRAVGGSAARLYETGRPRSILAMAAKAEVGLGGYLAAYRSSASDPSVGTLKWEAQVTGEGSGTGRLESGPVADDNLLIIATTDSTDNPEIPVRDAQLLAYDFTGAFSALPPAQRRRSQDALPRPTVSIPLASAGTSAEIYSAPAMGYVRAADTVTLGLHPVQVAAIAANTLPRIGKAAVGRLMVAPLMLQFAASGWDRAWLKDLTLADTADNQAVRVYVPGPAPPGSRIQIPPHQNDDFNAPLNYVRQYRAGQIEIIFTRWSQFSNGRFCDPVTGVCLPVGFSGFQAEYQDNTGQTRTLSSIQPQVAFRQSLRAQIGKSRSGSPCLAGNIAYVGSDSIDAFPNRSIPGNVAALRIDLTEGMSEVWTFFGDQTGGPMRRANDEFFSEFPFTPAHASDTLYVASNYLFTMNRDSMETTPLTGGPVGVLYALDLKASTALLNPGTSDPVLPMGGGRLALQAPLGRTADPNQTVAVDSRGSPIWITSNLVNDNAQDAIPQRTGLTSNWVVDFLNGVVRLGPGAYGKYSGRLLRVRYFVDGEVQPRTALMQVTPLVKWAFHFAGLNPATGEQTTNWQILSAPVVSGGTVHVVVGNPTAGTYAVSFPEIPTAGAPPDPVWTPVNLSVNPPTQASLAIEGDIVAGTFSSANSSVVAFENPTTLIADSARLLEVKSTNSALSGPPATYYLHQNLDRGVSGARQLLEAPPDQSPLDIPLRAGQDRVAFVTQAGRPNATSIRPGTWRFVFRAAAVGGGKIWVIVRTGAGAPPLFPIYGPEGPPSASLPSSMGEVVLDVPAPGLTLNASDRIYLEVWTDTPSGATLRVEGATFARMQTPIGGPANSQHLYWTASSAAEYNLDASLGALGIPKQDSYADRVLKGFSHPARARRLPDGNLLVCDTGNNRVVEIDRQGAVVWQYPDSDIANSPVPALYRAPTEESKRLLAPTDVQRYRLRTTESITIGGTTADRTVDWVTTLIADSGNNRLVEVMRPLIDGHYDPAARAPAPHPWLPRQVYEQLATVIGPNFGVSRPYYFDPSLALTPTRPASATSFSTPVPGGTSLKLLSFLTATGEPGLSALQEGIWAFSFTANADITLPGVTARIFFEVWRVDSAGAPVGSEPIVRTQLSPALLAQPERLVITAGKAIALPLNNTDRLLVEVWAAVEGAGPATVYFHYGREFRSRVAVPFGSMGTPLMLTTVDRTVEPTGPFSTVVLASAANHPADPTPGIYGAAGDRAVSLVSIALAQDAAGNAIAGALAREDGVNLFRARATEANDFLHTRQAERVRVWDSTGRERLERALVVDDAGVKFFDAINWNDQPIPIVEIRAKPSATPVPGHETNYEGEMASIASRYPSLEYALPENAGFFPACAQFLPDGRLTWRDGNQEIFVGGRFLVVNSQPRRFSGGTSETAVAGPTKSEVLEIDPSQPPGQRILHGDGSYFIIPDPFSLGYPSIAGAGTGLRQPLWAER